MEQAVLVAPGSASARQLAADRPPPDPPPLEEWLMGQQIDEPDCVAAKLRAEGFDTVDKLRVLTPDGLKELDLSLGLSCWTG